MTLTNGQTIITISYKLPPLSEIRKHSHNNHITKAVFIEVGHCLENLLKSTREPFFARLKAPTNFLKNHLL